MIHCLPHSNALRQTGVIGFSLAVLFVGSTVQAACFEEASAMYGVPATILRGVSTVESSNNPLAVNRSHVLRTKSVDIGMMQINSRHLPALSKFGITHESLLDGCTNVKIGAWLLAQLFNAKGVSWDAVGANNAACTQLKGDDCQRARATYAWKVYRAIRREEQGNNLGNGQQLALAMPSNAAAALAAPIPPVVQIARPRLRTDKDDATVFAPVFSDDTDSGEIRE